MVKNPEVFIRVAKNYQSDKWNVCVHYPDRKELFQSLRELRERTGRKLRKACQIAEIGGKPYTLKGYTFA